jgi:5-carboxymethyl-2-hydroxymuconate isomerase
MSGRSEEQKNNLGNILLKKLNDFFKDLPNFSNLSISLEIAELQNYFK